MNISSLSGLVGFAGQTMYSATKGAIKQFTEGLAEELVDTSIHVATVFPGNISTNIIGNSGVEMLEIGNRRVKATTPEQAAAQIVEAIAKNRSRVVIGSDALMLDRLARLAPTRAIAIVARQMKSVL